MFIKTLILILLGFSFSCTTDTSPKNKVGYEFETYQQLMTNQKQWASDMYWAKFSAHIDDNITSEKLKKCHELGIVPYIVLIPFSRFDKNVNVNEILEGVYDEVFTSIAKEIKKTRFPVYVQFPTKKSLNINNEQFLKMYHYIADQLKEDGAFNVNWVFEVTDKIESSSSIKKIFPGTDYVDYFLTSNETEKIIMKNYPKYKIIKNHTTSFVLKIK